jgi:N-acetylglucosamine-6-phosphate deacetylase
VLLVGRRNSKIALYLLTCGDAPVASTSRSTTTLNSELYIVTSPFVDDYVDLQVNGFLGIDFNQPTITVAELRKAAEAMRAEGVRSALPTIITGSLADMSRCIGTLHDAIEQDEICASVFAGIHVEGPFISRVPGYIGAHPPQHALEADLAALEHLIEAGRGKVKLVTLAPEVDRHGALTRYLVDRGILVAAGHTDASLDDLDRCIESGLRLFTHLGNGCPPEMHRHDNIIYRALSRSERLYYTLIADGFHVPKLLFEILLRWVPLGHLAVVSDAISAAGLGPGTYRLAGREVSIGPDKAARDPSGKHFVGSASSMRDADRWLQSTLRLGPAERTALLASHPAAWLRGEFATI